MRQFLEGVLSFGESVRRDASIQEAFAQLATGQRPDTLYIGCSDSRVVPNLFSFSEPGDLFVVRNVGNMIPPCRPCGVSTGDHSEAAVLEYAVLQLQVRDIVICGHSGCGAIAALHAGVSGDKNPNLVEWLRLGQPALDAERYPASVGIGRDVRDATSQRNVLQQLEHVSTYPFVAEAISTGRLQLHGWWFDIAAPAILSYQADRGTFLPVEQVYTLTDSA